MNFDFLRNGNEDDGTIRINTARPRARPAKARPPASNQRNVKNGLLNLLAIAVMVAVVAIGLRTAQERHKNKHANAAGVRFDARSLVDGAISQYWSVVESRRPEADAYMVASHVVWACASADNREEFERWVRIRNDHARRAGLPEVQPEKFRIRADWR